MSVVQNIQVSIHIGAPLERCFALSTRVELVQRTLGMKLVDGVTSGHINVGSRVVWRGWKFGLPTEHHTLITKFEAPRPETVDHGIAQFDGQEVAMFEDSQEKGRFAYFRHEHFFRAQRDGSTELEDRVHFALPLGAAGRLVAKVVLGPHIRKLARERFAMIKELAEGDGWREWVASDGRK